MGHALTRRGGVEYRSPQKTIGIIGAGAFGCAIAHLLSELHHSVLLYSHEINVVEEINTQRTNSAYLPDFHAFPGVYASNNPAELLSCEIVFCAVPVPHLRSCIEHIAKHIRYAQQIVALSKGIEEFHDAVPTEIIANALGESSVELFAMSGPTFAHEIVRGKKSFAMIGGGSEQSRESIAYLFHPETLVLEPCEDLRGLQFTGALKNVLALAANYCYAVTRSENTRAAVLTMGLEALGDFLEQSGSSRLLAYSIAGVGDVMLSSYYEHGRNARLGGLLGSGIPLDTALTHFTSHPESIATLKALPGLMIRKDISVPFFSNVYDVIIDHKVRKFW